tara:strand:- start:4035 stop:5123 length:1089 start_codon:yes stop_codon:yes gene_type:complete
MTDDHATAIAANTDKTSFSNLTGEVTSSGAATTIAENIVDEANLKVSNAPTNGYFLSAQSGDTGGLTWAAAGGGGGATNLTATTHPSQITINSSDGDNVVVAEASGSIAGVMTVAHHDKLDGIEASATADQTKADIDGLAITTVGTLDTGNATGIVTDASTSAKGIASFSSDNFAASSGAITIKDGGVDLTAEVTGVLPSANLDADTAHLTTDQTFTGVKQINLRKFPVSSGTDGNAIGDVVYFGGTTSMVIGRIYHYKSDGTWELANPNAAATSDGLLGVALGAASDTNGVLLRGMVTLDHDTGAVGDVLYLDEQLVDSAYGAATSGAPAATGDIVRVIGYCLHATAGNILFNPDNTWLEI